MSRRAAIIEDEFDDDTDLPLPSQVLPNTGTRGPILQEMHISDDEIGDADDVSSSRAASASAAPVRPAHSSGPRTVTDITPYKTWTCIYPIYLDAKRPYGTGERRVERPKALWWPLSKDIADACTRLGLGTLHEVNKSHPRDWENPGRVRVQWKKDGKLVNPHIKTKKQLLEMVSIHIQMVKPENIPKPPYNLTASHPQQPPPSLEKPPSSAGSNQTLALPAPPSPNKDKGKQPATSNTLLKSKTQPTTPHPPSQLTSANNRPPTGRRLPLPPHPYPNLPDRVSQYSPAISSGVLIETIKAGMNAGPGGMDGMLGGPGGPGQGGQGGQGGKGKRKVVRVRA